MSSSQASNQLLMSIVDQANQKPSGITTVSQLIEVLSALPPQHRVIVGSGRLAAVYINREACSVELDYSNTWNDDDPGSELVYDAFPGMCVEG